MNTQQGHRTDATHETTPAVRAFSKLMKMDRAEELCLVTAALCAFGTALAAQARQS